MKNVINWIIAILKFIMTYFKDRNKLRHEYSGHDEASMNLRRRLLTVCNKRLRSSVSLTGAVQHRLEIELMDSSLQSILLTGDYGDVFHALEIFMNEFRSSSSRYDGNFLTEIIEAFELSGSVYEITGELHVELKPDPETAEKIKDAIIALENNPSSLETYKSAVGALMSRSEKPAKVVNASFIAFEDYLKAITKENSYSEAIKHLQKKKFISQTQYQFLDKISAYRSDSAQVAHAGNGPEPTEIDAIWFVEEVATQIKLIDKKIKNAVPESKPAEEQGV